ncbi:hypothetical protein, partial [Klebsiella pneumoniae]|uniref:hypothetical protein n=1 Tax=Klebsiella pneumoniae TaxID=573 RepID=UPI001C85E9EA
FLGCCFTSLSSFSFLPSLSPPSFFSLLYTIFSLPLYNSSFFFIFITPFCHLPFSFLFPSGVPDVLSDAA